MVSRLMEGKLLTTVKQILINKNLAEQKTTLTELSRELHVDSLDCAAALLYLLENHQSLMTEAAKTDEIVYQQPHIKMVRYRLAIGSKHQLRLDELKRVLVEESGVDKNNINNINIQDCYTLIDLPDEMPLDIFQHLKTVEINQQKLDIKRVKNRNKHHRGNHHRRGRQKNRMTNH